MSEQVGEWIATFDALPEPDKPIAAAAILRRLPLTEGDLPLSALDELADELFRNEDGFPNTGARGSIR